MRNGKNWSREDTKMLKTLYNQGMAYEDIAKHVHRTENAVRSRASILMQENKIKRRPKTKFGKHKKAIRCIETGKIWESRTELAQWAGCSITTVVNRLKFREPLNGLHYESIE